MLTLERFLDKLMCMCGDPYCFSCGHAQGTYPMSSKQKKTNKQPSLKTMERWVSNGIAKATDGCKVEPDGICPHGFNSWLIELGYI